MSVNTESFYQLNAELKKYAAVLVAVSKMKPVADIEALYALGQRDFGENYVQELIEKAPQLPAGIKWHFIGHLQSNKIKYIAPFVHLIHGVDSFRLLKEIDKQGVKFNKKISVLLQVFIASETTKFGMNEKELAELMEGAELSKMHHIEIRGFMGMASFADDEAQIRREFAHLKALLQKYKAQEIANTKLEILSMGMSGDYMLALEEGSNMVRIGSMLFGGRQ